jgi:peptidoglycan/xylan/chitin deacetylase (PgdA/CDA1 family)
VKAAGFFGKLIGSAAIFALVGVAPAMACDPGSGVARVVEIAPGDRIGAATGYPPAPLNDHEVVLTFDDGPNPHVTPGILDILASRCLRAAFFPIGENARDHLRLVKRELAEGHTVGGHTFSHADLSGIPFSRAKREIQAGFAPLAAAGAPAAFLRLPELRAPKRVMAWLKEQGIAVIGVDIDGSDWKGDPPDEELARIEAELASRGRGIIIMHDSQPNTAIYLPHLLDWLQQRGYRIVQIRPASAPTAPGSPPG